MVIYPAAGSSHRAQEYVLRMDADELTSIMGEIAALLEEQPRRRPGLRRLHDVLHAWLYGVSAPPREPPGEPLVRLGPGGDYVHDYPCASGLSPEAGQFSGQSRDREGAEYSAPLAALV